MPDQTPNPIDDPERSTISDSNPSARTVDRTVASIQEEGALLERVRMGDQSAMAEVFDRYGGIVYSVALRILKDSGHAEDVMQEVLFQLWRRPDAFLQGRGSLGA